MMTCDICGRLMARRPDGELIGGAASLASMQHKPQGDLQKLMLAKGIRDIDNEGAKELITGLAAVVAQAEGARTTALEAGFDTLVTTVDTKYRGRP